MHFSSSSSISSDYIKFNHRSANSPCTSVCVPYSPHECESQFEIVCMCTVYSFLIREEHNGVQAKGTIASDILMSFKDLSTAFHEQFITTNNGHICNFIQNYRMLNLSIVVPKS